MLKIESERYAAQNGRECEALEEAFSSFWGINILMGIHTLLLIKRYWAAGEGPGNLLFQKNDGKSLIYGNSKKYPFY